MRGVRGFPTPFYIFTRPATLKGVLEALPL
jgi:hypothetical protein